MKYSLRDLALTVAIVALAIAFYLHRAGTEREIHHLKTSTQETIHTLEKSMKHDLMKFEFENKFSGFLDSFNDSDHVCKTSNVKYISNDTSGCYKFDCVLSRRDGQPMTGQNFADLLKQITNGYRTDTEKHWSVDTGWEIESTIYTMKQESWEIDLTIEYNFTTRNETGQ